MKGNTADQRHLTDTNHPSNLSMSAHDRSQQEDSNIFLLPMNDNLNSSTIEDSVIPKLGSSSQRGPSRQLSTGKIQTLTNSQVVNARVSTSRFQSNPMIIPPSETTSMDFSRPIQLDESEIISRSTSEKRNIGHFLAVKESRVPLGLRETDNTIKYTSGDDDRFNQSKPIDLKDYGSYDYREEQDIVHSLGIKNQYVTRRSGRENRADDLEEEEVKEITGSGKDKGNVNNNNRLEVQRVAAEVITIRSSSANIAVRDVEESALDESAVEQQNAEPRRNNSNASNNNNNEGQNQSQNERRNRANNVTANAQQLATQQATAAQQSVQGLEVRPYLRIRIGFFATLMLCSVLLWLYLNAKVELTHIIIPLYPYFAYLFVEGIVGGFKTQRIERWQKRDHKLDAFSAVTCIAALILVHLQLLGKLSYSVLAVAPLLVSATIYPFHSIASDSIKISSAMFRFICTLQTALITLKLDSIIEIDWAFVLLVCLVYMGVALAYCIIYGFFILLLFILSIFRGYRGGALGRKIQFLGLVWYFLYYGISGITFILIVGVSQANEVKSSYDLLQLAAKVGVILGAFLMIYSSIFFKSLVKFIFVHFETGGLVGNPRNANAARPRPTISFLVANDETYFINLSSTYFLPLTPGFMAKSKENIERIKSLFRDLRLRKPQTKQTDKNTSTTKGRKKIKVQTLKDYKKALDEKLTNLFKKKNEEPNSPGTGLNKFLQYFSPKQANIPRKFNINPDSSSAKLSLSVGNLDDLEGVYSVQKPNTAAGEEEKLCYLCYAHPPDSILMNCGHGGFCYNCAISAIKAKNECMECRTKVDFIHKLDSEKNLKGIVKAVEVRKVIVTEPPQVDNPFR